jgi:tetratricopeptide (TPR) repeat protein
MRKNRLVLFILFTFCLIFSHSFAFGEPIRAFVPDKQWEIAIEMNDFTPWDVLMSKTILGGNASNNEIIITILAEKENRPFTPGEVLKKYWHYGPPGEHVTEFTNENMIIVSAKETDPMLGKTFNGYVVKEDYSFDIHISAKLSKTTKQDVVNIIRSFRISQSPEKQAMENLINDLKSAKDKRSREQLLLAFTNKYPKNSWAFMLLGEMYFSMEQNKMAQKAYLQALENHKTQPMVNPMNVWLCYDGLGLTYGMSQQYEPAKSFFEKGYKCAESMGNNKKLATSAYNMACLYSETNDYKTSLKYLEKAISLNPEEKIRARTDSSFAGMRNQVDFKKLVSE